MDMTKIKNMSYEEIAAYVSAALHCEAELKQMPRLNMDPETCLLLKKDAKDETMVVFHLGKVIESYPNETICDLTSKIYVSLEHDAPIKIDEVILPLKKAVPVLINTAANVEFLKSVPHREIMDLSVIYKIPITGSNGFSGAVTVTNKMAKAEGATEEDLYKSALKNLRPSLRTLSSVMAEMMSIMGGGMDASDDSMLEIPDIYVLSNEKNLQGASCILKEEVLKEMAEKYNSDLYILPSSIHEVLIVPADNKEDDMDQTSSLFNMVCEVNSGVVGIEEKLSDSLYRYSLEAGLTLAASKNNP